MRPMEICLIPDHGDLCAWVITSHRGKEGWTTWNAKLGTYQARCHRQTPFNSTGIDAACQ